MFIEPAVFQNKDRTVEKDQAVVIGFRVFRLDYGVERRLTWKALSTDAHHRM